MIQFVEFIEVPGGPDEKATYFVGVATEHEANAKVQELYQGDPITMTAGRLTESSLEYLKLEIDEVRSPS